MKIPDKILLDERHNRVLSLDDTLIDYKLYDKDVLKEVTNTIKDVSIVGFPQKGYFVNVNLMGILDDVPFGFSVPSEYFLKYLNEMIITNNKINKGFVTCFDSVGKPWFIPKDSNIHKEISVKTNE